MKLPVPVTEGPLLPWLIESLPSISRTRVKEWLRDGRIHVNGDVITQFNQLIRPGDVIVVGEPPRTLPQGPPIVFEDEHLIIVDKPAGLLSVATEDEKGKTAFALLNDYLAARHQGKPYVVHRLDRDTSGLLLFARSPAMRDQLQANWAAVVKTYLAVVEGVPQPPEGVIENFISEGKDLRVRITKAGEGAKWAVTRYRVVGERGKWSLVEVGLETGRKHQIRVHLGAMGNPVIGDTMYGAKTNPAKRLGLHAWRLAFDHPITGDRVAVESQLPAVLRNVGK